MMEIICDKEKCTACAACMNTCAHNAITMEAQSSLGYVYPVIDASKCVDCGLCVKTCPANNPIELHKPLKAFAAISKNHDDLMTSASGGASSVLCQAVLKRGGIVYGCVQRNYKDIAHRRISRYEDYPLMKGSKYVQSNINYIYRDVKNDLKDGFEVLFTGTPCQIAGLRAYLKKDYQNLYLVDLVCHGVPSQKLLADDVEKLLRDFPNADRGNVCVEFRRKQEVKGVKKFVQNWGDYISYGLFISMEQKMVSYKRKKQFFLNNNYITSFMAGTILRDNCFLCPYAQSLRGSDITIADFWGIKESTVPTTNGVSLLLPCSEKGIKLIQDSRDLLHCEERPVKEAINGNGQLMHPSEKPNERKIFLQYYPTNQEKAYKYSLQKYRSDYRAHVIIPRIYKRYEQLTKEHTILKLLDHIRPFRSIALRCAYQYAKFI